MNYDEGLIAIAIILFSVGLVLLFMLMELLPIASQGEREDKE